MLVKGFDRMLAAAVEAEDEISEDLLTLTTTEADQSFSFLANRDARTTVYWGDGSKTVYPGSVSQATYSHTYAEPGDYTVKVTSIARLANLRCNSALLTTVVNLPTLVNDNIAVSAFDGATNLVSVPLPDKVLAIGNYAFRNCSSLELDGLPETTTTIGVASFQSCAKLQLAALPAALVTIYDSAFYKTPGVSVAEWPPKLVRIGAYAFSNGSTAAGNVMSFDVFPASLQTIGSQALRYCKWTQRRILFKGKPNQIGAANASNATGNATGTVFPDYIYVPWTYAERPATGNPPYGFTGTRIVYSSPTTWEEIEARQVDPVLYHPLNEMLDTTPTGQACTLTGESVEATTYKGIDCLRFHTSATYLAIQNPVSKPSQGGAQCAFSVWVACTGNRSTYQGTALLRFGGTNDELTFGSGFGLQLNSSGHPINVLAWLHNTGTGNSNKVLMPPGDTDWHHVVFNCDVRHGWTGTQWSADVYDNGVLLGKVSIGVNNNAFSSTLTLGRGNGNQSGVSVYFAGLRVWDFRNLSEDEIATLYNEYHPTQE